MMTWRDFLQRVIDEGIAAARRDYNLPEQEDRLRGSIDGFKSCEGKTIPELGFLLDDAREKANHARLRDNYWYWRCYEAEVEWVCNVASAALLNVKQPIIVTPSARGTLKAAEILGVANDLEGLSIDTKV